MLYIKEKNRFLFCAMMWEHCIYSLQIQKAMALVFSGKAMPVQYIKGTGSLRKGCYSEKVHTRCDYSVLDNVLFI